MVCTPWILTFLLIAVASQSQETPELEKTVEKQKILIDVLNNFRRQTANKLQISYMHELIYDETLYQQFDLRYKKDIPSFEIDNYTTVFKDLKSYTSAYWKKSETGVYRGSAIGHGVSEDIIQYLSPLQQMHRGGKWFEMLFGTDLFFETFLSDLFIFFHSNVSTSYSIDSHFRNFKLIQNMDLDLKPLILFNLETLEDQKKFYDDIKIMHERRNDERDPFERQQLKEDIDNDIIDWNEELYPEAWNYFDTHFMSEERLAEYAESVYDMMTDDEYMGVRKFTFNTGRGIHSPNGEPAIQNRLLKTFKGRPRCDVRIDEYNEGLVILECW
ncbi:hypothetical protein CRE_14630 [Caenorhabditis remanei]|uniref:Smr domain-containing protein n=1 Tax=Caenorhabditis remanei TaxID=31234 RepID=E3M967_CAERE|nr:hypothetical protein CRE_14630 [Caenorhabditis remanei]